MEFSETEVRFLRQEHATRRLRPLADLREIGCPARIFERILEDRARKLGPELAALRVKDVAIVPPDDLDARIAANKLF